ncbi:hypothetical protein N7468_006282 [Penicillium chermesinum]|uniref:Uncharacterized protein n=1 Tax=Penicillium chermesinum TaxID=63820 RepID=A0A9W9NRX9_9EURO|nr:uncharacterized protein N7468_006282 [Penicillium chermesinum]KAJ5225057.1 hypothetical protein N7468_006282 [Penicillium chermesinum]
MDISQISEQLTETPNQFPGCCLRSLAPFLNALITLLPKLPHYTLSIGSGSGLLEGLITYRDADTVVEGVEVNSSVNRFVPEEAMHVVGGAWGLCPRAKDAAAWMFVYPRDPRLVAKYLDQYGDGAVEVVLWLRAGIRLGGLRGVFCWVGVSEIRVLEGIGLAPYEAALLARRP